MAITFSGGTAKPLLTAQNFRAEAHVEVLSASGATIGSFQCLLDTGSDYTLLPDFLLPLLGLTTTHTANFSGVGGTSYHLPLVHYPPLGPGINLVVEGVPIRVGVAFYSSGFTPILGRNEALCAFDFGFNTTQWYRG